VRKNQCSRYDNEGCGIVHIYGTSAYFDSIKYAELQICRKIALILEHRICACINADRKCAYSRGQKYVNMAENLLLHFGENLYLTTTNFRKLHNELIILLCVNFQRWESIEINIIELFR